MKETVMKVTAPHSDMRNNNATRVQNNATRVQGERKNMENDGSMATNLEMQGVRRGNRTRNRNKIWKIMGQ